MQTVFNPDVVSTFSSIFSYYSITHALAYKPVAKKIRSVVAWVDGEFRITRTLPDDPLLGLPSLPMHPPDFIPGECFTQERADTLDLNPVNWLWPEEVKLCRWIICTHEKAFAWVPDERGCFDEQYFPPVKIPTVLHTPWVLRNIPIPPSKWNDTIQIIKDHIATGVYEPSTATYCSHWFCVLKQDGKSLRLVHDLQPLNAVTIQDLSTPPFVEHLAESFSGYVVYGMMDLFTRYDQQPLHPESWDLTTFNSFMGPYRLTTGPMGYTNVVQIYQADICFILQEEIPHHTIPFIDNVAIKTLLTWYILPDSYYETIPKNPGIQWFIWEHLQVINHILQRFENVGITVSAKKFAFAVPEVTIVGHKCTWEGRIPHEKKVQKICDWPECQNLTQVHGFLGVCVVSFEFLSKDSLQSLIHWSIWHGKRFPSNGRSLRDEQCSV